MLDVKFSKFRYARLIVEKFDSAELQKMKKYFDSINIISYREIDLNNFSMIKKKSIVIDLSMNIDKIFAKFNDTTRNEIKKTEKIKGLNFTSPDNDIENIYKLHREFDLSRGWKPRPKEEFYKTKNFSARFNGITISVITTFEHDVDLRICRIFSNRLTEPKNKKIIGFASRRLVFEVCKYGIANGYKKLDLGGIDFDDPVKTGISRFKSGFGGEPVDNFSYKYETTDFCQFKKLCDSQGIDIS